MKIPIIIIAALLSGASFAASAVSPMKYVAAVRDAEGKALADREMTFSIEILDSPTATEALYAESHRATSQPDGTVTLMIGAGDNQSQATYDDIDWRGARYLRVSVNADGQGYRTLGVSELGASPLALKSDVTNALVCTSPSGTPWQLTVSDSGVLTWECLGEIPDTPPAYPAEKIPERLYFIGNFNNWDVTQAVEMDKLSKYCFSITRRLTVGEIFKFVPAQTWANEHDWSGMSSAISTTIPMREQGNTPDFAGPDGDYVITVDFHSFTMTITPK